MGFVIVLMNLIITYFLVAVFLLEFGIFYRENVKLGGMVDLGKTGSQTYQFHAEVNHSSLS